MPKNFTIANFKQKAATATKAVVNNAASAVANKSGAVDEQLKKSFSRFYKGASEADVETFVANVRAKGGQRVTMSQLQEHFVQHRTSSMAAAMTEIKLGEVGGDDTSSYSQSFYS